MSFEVYPITDYAAEEVKRVESNLPPLVDGDFRFAFLADLHYKYIREMRTSVSNIVHAMNSIHKNHKIEFLCFGGDNIGNYPNTKEDHIDMMHDLASFFPYFDMPVISVMGNHDDNSIHSRIDPTSKKTFTTTVVSNEEQYDALFAGHEKIENFHLAHEKSLYGYLDMPKYNTRVVFLHATDVPYIIDHEATLADGRKIEGDIMRYNQQWFFSYSQEQLTWLADTALQNAPENVIFIGHAPFHQNRMCDGEQHNAKGLDEITSAFAKGEKVRTVSGEPDFAYDVTADFHGEKHHVLLRLGGHNHIDTVDRDEYGFLDVTTMLAGRKGSGMEPEDDGYLPEREPYTASETSVDIVTVSPKRGKIFFTRYGSGRDRVCDIDKK